MLTKKDELHQSVLLTALEHGLNLTINPKQGDALIGVKVIDHDKVQNLFTLQNDTGDTTTINLFDIRGVSSDELAQTAEEVPVLETISDKLARFHGRIVTIVLHDGSFYHLSSDLGVMGGSFYFMDDNKHPRNRVVNEIAEIHIRG